MNRVDQPVSLRSLFAFFCFVGVASLACTVPEGSGGPVDLDEPEPDYHGTIPGDPDPGGTPPGGTHPGGSQPSDTLQPPPGETSSIDQESLAAYFAYFSSNQVVQAEENATYFLVGAVYLATEASPPPADVAATGFGTLTEQEQEGLFYYSPEPADRLRVELRSGLEVDFIINKMVGDFTKPSTEFLDVGHDLEYRVIVGHEDFRITSEGRAKQGERYTMIYGQVVIFETLFNVDVGRRTYHAFSTSGGVSELNAEDSRGGTAEAGEFSLTIDEHTERLAYYSGQLGAYNESTSAFASQWTLSGQGYSFRDGLIHRRFTDTKPSDVDRFWTFNGDLLRGQSVIGQVEPTIESNTLSIWLNTPTDQIQLESHRLN